MDQISSPSPLTSTALLEPTIKTVPRLSFMEAAKLRAEKLHVANNLS